MSFRSDRYAAQAVLTAATTLRAGIIHPYDTSGGAIAQTLPDAATFGASNSFCLLLETAGNSLTISPDAGDTINGSTDPLVLSTAGESVLLVRDATATNWLVIAGRSVGGSGVVQTFMFQPGGAGSGPVIYSDWEDLMAAMGAVAGPKELYFDDQFAPIVIPEGDWDMTDVEWRAASMSTFNPGQRVQIQIGNNTTLPGLVRFRGPLQIDYIGDSGSPVELTSGASVSIYDGASIDCGSDTEAFFLIQDGQASFFIGGPRECVLGGSGETVISLDESSASFFLGVGAQIAENAIFGDATSAVTFNVQSTSVVVAAQANFAGTASTVVEASLRYSPIATLLPTFGEIVLVNTGANISLPTIIPGEIGHPVAVVKTVGDASATIVQADAGQTINGSPSGVSWDEPYGSRVFVPDDSGTNWTVLGIPPDRSMPRFFPVGAFSDPQVAEYNWIVEIPSGTWTVQLPPSGDTGYGLTVGVKKLSADADPVTILPDGTDTIDGELDYTLTDAKGCVMLVQNSGNWSIYAKYS